MSLLSGASTYAVGQIAIGQLESHGEWGSIDLDKAKAKYQEWFEKGIEWSNLKDWTTLCPVIRDKKLA